MACTAGQRCLFSVTLNDYTVRKVPFSPANTSAHISLVPSAGVKVKLVH